MSVSLVYGNDTDKLLVRCWRIRIVRSDIVTVYVLRRGSRGGHN